MQSVSKMALYHYLLLVVLMRMIVYDMWSECFVVGKHKKIPEKGQQSGKFNLRTT